MCASHFPSLPSISCMNTDMSHAAAVLVLGTSSACFVFMLQSRLQGDRRGFRSRHHHNLIQLDRGEARGVCQWVAGQQQKHEYACLIDVPYAYLVSRTNRTTVFGLLHACCFPCRMENQLRMSFSDTMLSETGPPFRVEADLKTISENGILEISSFGSIRFANWRCGQKTFISGYRVTVLEVTSISWQVWPYPKLGPHFRVGTDLKTISDCRSHKIHQCAIQKRSFSDPDSVFTRDGHNNYTYKIIAAAQRRLLSFS